jgi:hypothetical protein
MSINDPRYLGSAADVTRGAQIGAGLGLVFALRSSLGAADALSRQGHSNGNPWLVGATVFLAACGADAVLGALQPLARRLPVAIALGCGVVFPLVLTLDVIRNHVTSPPGTIEWGVDVASALILGTLGTVAVRTVSPSKRPA